MSGRIDHGLVVALLAALTLPTCSSPDVGGGILRAGGDLASALTGDDRFSQLGEASARSLRSADDFLPREEHFIGRAVGAAALSNGRFALLDDPVVSDYVNRVGLAVAYSSPAVRQTFKGYRFGVVDSAELNAFAAPGGFVFITTGMLRETRNEEELAGILAHEIAHVTLRHGLKAISQSNLVEAGGLLTALAADHASAAASDKLELQEQLKNLSLVFGQSVDEVVFTLLSGGYGADQEFAADDLGSRMAAEAGYAKNAVGRFLAHLPDAADGGGWLSTHPAASDRVEQLAASGAGGETPGMELRQRRHQTILARLR